MYVAFSNYLESMNLCIEENDADNKCSLSELPKNLSFFDTSNE